MDFAQRVRYHEVLTSMQIVRTDPAITCMSKCALILLCASMLWPEGIEQPPK